MYLGVHDAEEYNLCSANSYKSSARCRLKEQIKIFGPLTAYRGSARVDLKF